MPGHHFISYSSVDALDFALQLRDALEAGAPPISVWLDKGGIPAGQDWDEPIAKAIKTCDSLLFVMTPDSVEDESVCKDEWSYALRYKKPIIPLKLHRDAEMPFRLGNRQHIDFTHALDSEIAFNSALAKLRQRLRQLASPSGVLEVLNDRLADARRDLRRARGTEQTTRIQDDIALLEKQIAEQERIIADPEAAAKEVEERIASGVKREQQPEKPVGGVARSKFINPPPLVAPTYFQDRHVETALIGDFLKDESLRLMMIVGRGGIGKTAMVCRLLKALESGRLPEDGGPLSVDGIVYLSAIGSRRVTMPNLYVDLSKLLSQDVAQQLDALYKDPHATSESKMQALLENFPTGRIVLLLDNFEDVVDPATLNIRDTELGEALRALLSLPHHVVKVIVTTRIAPRDLSLEQPGRQTRLDLDEGLPTPHAENILREMDADGKVGLKEAPDALLNEARERTRGYPRALEALFAILSADRATTLREVLDDSARLLPENVVKVLVGEAFSRLDLAAQQVMQALAIYSRPATPAAVDYLLQPYLPGVNSAPILNRLVNMQFARKEAGRYYLHPVDHAYALERLPKGQEWDRHETWEPDAPEAPPYTQFALFRRAADYFQQARKPREDWKTIEDLAPQLTEFELRCAGWDYDTAATVLSVIDFDYLQLWGYYRLLVDLHERLQGKLDDPVLKMGNANSLGTAYYRLGQYRKAISCYERALTGTREIKSRPAEGIVLGNLGNCYSGLGQTARAIKYYEQALTIAGEIDDHDGEGAWLGNLGNRYSNLGRTAQAIEYCEQALTKAREVGDRQMEGYNLCNLAEELVNGRCYQEAVQYAEESVEIADEIGSPLLSSYGNSNLALAKLYASDLLGARAAAEIARQHDQPENNHYVLALLGLIASRQGDHTAAQEAFTSAVAQANALLDHSAQNYNALDSKGLALCGLALCEGSDNVAAAIEAYRAARVINKDVGVVGRVLRLFDALAVVDSVGVLREVRTVAAGE